MSVVTSFFTRGSARMRKLTNAASGARASSPRAGAAPRVAADDRVAASDRAVATDGADATEVLAVPAKRDAARPGAALQTVTSLATRAASSAAPLIGRAASNAGPLFARAGASAGPFIARAGANAGPLLARAASSAGPLLGRVSRVNPVILAIPIGLVLLGLFVLSPLDDAIVDVLRGPSSSASATANPRPALAPAPFVVPPLSAYGAAFESQGAYPTTTPNGTVEWVVALRNTGSAGWYRGIEGAQAALALPNGAGVAVQSTDYVGPGQVGWFVVKFRARAELGTYNVQLLPRIDGRGPLQDLGIYTVVTVKNP